MHIIELNKCLMEDFKVHLDSCIKTQPTSATHRMKENVLLNLILLMFFNYRDRMVLRGWWAPTTHCHQQLPASTDTPQTPLSWVTGWFSVLQDCPGTRCTERGEPDNTGGEKAAQHYSSGLGADTKSFLALLQNISQVFHASRSLYKMQAMLSLYCCGHWHKMWSGNTWVCFIVCP